MSHDYTGILPVDMNHKFDNILEALQITIFKT